MAVRHEVENLIRRGNIFYWRPRVPRTFSRCSNGARLSLSLNASDHRKAQYLARRLNTLLAELKYGPAAGMTTKEQLAKLFAAERDAMHEHLDDVALMSRRNGRADDITDVEMDLENGYAYRLLEKWGLRRELDFSSECPGRRMLERFGVPEPHIANVAANFHAERKMLNSRAFEDALRRMMRELDIPDTAQNRERAIIAYSGGRADALLDAEDRYPLADRTKSALTGGRPPDPTVTSTEILSPVIAGGEQGALAEVLTGERSADRLLADTVPIADSLTPEGSGTDGIEDELPVPGPDGEAQVPDEVEEGRGSKLLPLHAFNDAYEELRRNKGDEWTKETANDARALVRIFTGILAEHQIEHSGQITQYHLGRLRQHFNEIPTRYGQSARLRAMSTSDLRLEALRMQEDAEKSGKKPPKIGLGAATVRKHLGNLDQFLKHLRGHGYSVPGWTLDGIRPKKPKAGTVRHQQYKPKPDDVRPIFRTPLFTGTKSPEERHLAGGQIYHDSAFFLPMLLTYLGARRAELAGLAPDDLFHDADHGWTIHIRTNAVRRIKNIQSDRLVPLPDELVRLQFPAYAAAIRKLGYKTLFPELFSHLTENDPGDRFYKDFTPIMEKSLGKAMWERSYHALRHGFANTLKQNGVPAEVIDDLSGRLSEGETNTRYTDVAGIPLMRDALSKYPNITEHLEPHPIRLLPWVEMRLPPPWARKGRDKRL